MREIEDVKLEIKNISINQRKRYARIFWRRFSLNILPLVGIIIIMTFSLLTLLAPLLPLSDPNQVELSVRLRPLFSKSHLLGTDQFGRDMLSRMLWGGRISLLTGFSATLIAMIIGVFIGLISGYYSGIVDTVTMRTTDVFMSFPMILLGIVIIATLGPGLFNATLAVGLAGYPIYARIVRSSVLSVKNQEFVEAAKALGVGNCRTILHHILPNVSSPIIVAASLDVGNKIILISSLSFLGLGTQPPTADWGNMLSEGQRFLRIAPNITTIPGLAIFLTVLAFNLIGDGIRDALDPKAAASKEAQT